MIAGTVNAAREARIPLVLRAPHGATQEIDALIDTGFNGFLTLPPSLIAALGLKRLARGRAILADGREQLFDIHAVTVGYPAAHVLGKVVGSRSSVVGPQREDRNTGYRVLEIVKRLHNRCTTPASARMLRP